MFLLLLFAVFSLRIRDLIIDSVLLLSVLKYKSSYALECHKINLKYARPCTSRQTETEVLIGWERAQGIKSIEDAVAVETDRIIRKSFSHFNIWCAHSARDEKLRMCRERYISQKCKYTEGLQKALFEINERS